MSKINTHRDPEFAKRIPNRRVKVPTLKHLRDKEEYLKRKMRWFLDLRKGRRNRRNASWCFNSWFRMVICDCIKEIRGVREEIKRRSHETGCPLP